MSDGLPTEGSPQAASVPEAEPMGENLSAVERAEAEATQIGVNITMIEIPEPEGGGGEVANVSVGDTFTEGSMGGLGWENGGFDDTEALAGFPEAEGSEVIDERIAEEAALVAKMMHEAGVGIGGEERFYEQVETMLKERAKFNGKSEYFPRTPTAEQDVFDLANRDRGTDYGMKKLSKYWTVKSAVQWLGDRDRPQQELTPKRVRKTEGDKQAGEVELFYEVVIDGEQRKILPGEMIAIYEDKEGLRYPVMSGGRVVDPRTSDPVAGHERITNDDKLYVPYDTHAPKKLVKRIEDESHPWGFRLVEHETGEAVMPVWGFAKVPDRGTEFAVVRTEVNGLETYVPVDASGRALPDTEGENPWPAARMGPDRYTEVLQQRVCLLLSMVSASNYPERMISRHIDENKRPGPGEMHAGVEAAIEGVIQMGRIHPSTGGEALQGQLPAGIEWLYGAQKARLRVVGNLGDGRKVAGWFGPTDITDEQWRQADRIFTNRGVEPYTHLPPGDKERLVSGKDLMRAMIADVLPRQLYDEKGNRWVFNPNDPNTWMVDCNIPEAVFQRRMATRVVYEVTTMQEVPVGGGKTKLQEVKVLVPFARGIHDIRLPNIDDKTRREALKMFIVVQPRGFAGEKWGVDPESLGMRTMPPQMAVFGRWGEWQTALGEFDGLGGNRRGDYWKELGYEDRPRLAQDAAEAWTKFLQDTGKWEEGVVKNAREKGIFMEPPPPLGAFRSIKKYEEEIGKWERKYVRDRKGQVRDSWRTGGFEARPQRDGKVLYAVNDYTEGVAVWRAGVMARNAEIRKNPGDWDVGLFNVRWGWKKFTERQRQEAVKELRRSGFSDLYYEQLGLSWGELKVGEEVPPQGAVPVRGEMSADGYKQVLRTYWVEVEQSWQDWYGRVPQEMKNYAQAQGIGLPDFGRIQPDNFDDMEAGAYIAQARILEEQFETWRQRFGKARTDMDWDLKGFEQKGGVLDAAMAWADWKKAMNEDPRMKLNEDKDGKQMVADLVDEVSGMYAIGNAISEYVDLSALHDATLNNLHRLPERRKQHDYTGYGEKYDRIPELTEYFGLVAWGDMMSAFGKLIMPVNLARVRTESGEVVNVNSRSEEWEVVQKFYSKESLRPHLASWDAVVAQGLLERQGPLAHSNEKEVVDLKEAKVLVPMVRFGNGTMMTKQQCQGLAEPEVKARKGVAYEFEGWQIEPPPIKPQTPRGEVFKVQWPEILGRHGGNFDNAWVEYTKEYRRVLAVDPNVVLAVDPNVWREYEAAMRDYQEEVMVYERHWNGEKVGKERKTRKELVEGAIGRWQHNAHLTVTGWVTWEKRLGGWKMIEVTADERKGNMMRFKKAKGPLERRLTYFTARDIELLRRIDWEIPWRQAELELELTDDEWEVIKAGLREWGVEERLVYALQQEPLKGWDKKIKKMSETEAKTHVREVLIEEGRQLRGVYGLFVFEWLNGNGFGAMNFSALHAKDWNSYTKYSEAGKKLFDLITMIRLAVAKGWAPANDDYEDAAVIPSNPQDRRKYLAAEIKEKAGEVIKAMAAAEETALFQVKEDQLMLAEELIWMIASMAGPIEVPWQSYLNKDGDEVAFMAHGGTLGTNEYRTGEADMIVAAMAGANCHQDHTEMIPFAANNFVWVGAMNQVLKAMVETQQGVMDMRGRRGLPAYTKVVLRTMVRELGEALSNVETRAVSENVINERYKGPEDVKLSTSEVPVSVAGGIDAAVRKVEVEPRRRVTKKIRRGLVAGQDKKAAKKRKKQQQKQVKKK